MTEPDNDWSLITELDFSETTVTSLFPPTPPAQTTPVPQALPADTRTPCSAPSHEQPEPGVVQDVTDPPDTADRSTHSPPANLATATQTRLISDLYASTPIGVHLETQGGRLTRHMSTNRKMMDWRLTVRKKWLFIGDSNLARMPQFSYKDLQVDSYPGATFRHIESVLRKTAESTEVRVVLSLGINSRAQNAKDTTVKQTQAALRTGKIRFPAAQIWVPIVNFSVLLPLKKQNQLNTLNSHIQANMQFIPALTRGDFHTEGDNIHWTKRTAEHMLQHWLDHLK